MEQWASVLGFEGYYEISTHGRVRSLDREIVQPWRTYIAKGKLLSPSLLGRKPYLYPAVTLCRPGIKRKFQVHVLVARAFVPNPDDLPEVNHKDGNKLNPHFENLEWSSGQGNMNHAVVFGLMRPRRSQYYGVHYQGGRSDCWIVRPRHDGKPHFVGTYTSELAAAQAYNDYVLAQGLDRPLNDLSVPCSTTSSVLVPSGRESV